MTESPKNKPAHTDADWREILTPEQYHVMREHGTERAFTGPYLNNKEPGLYHCAGCGKTLFDAETKYESGSGWPSFWAPASADSVTLHRDASHGMQRVEVRCAECEAHLGHVFEDGPQPTGIRYCVNGTALSFETSGREE